MTDPKPDFRTPLPIHRAAFRRIGHTLTMPDSAREELRRRFQADERSGNPTREMRGVGEVLGSVVWRWPWFEDRAAELENEGLVPLDWEEAGLSPGVEWHDIPHGVKVRFVHDALMCALQTEKRLAELATIRTGERGEGYWLDLRSGDPRCQATATNVARRHAAIRGGDHAVLPPFFPGDRSYVELSDARNHRRRAERMESPLEQARPTPDTSPAPERPADHERSRSAWWRFGW